MTFCPYTILSIPFCQYHFVRYHFVLEPSSLYGRIMKVTTVHCSLFLVQKRPPPFKCKAFDSVVVFDVVINALYSGFRNFLLDVGQHAAWHVHLKLDPDITV